MTGARAGRTAPRGPNLRGPNHQPIPHPGTGRPTIDQLYRQAGGDRELFHRLVTTTWPTTPTKGPTSDFRWGAR